MANLSWRDHEQKASVTHGSDAWRHCVETAAQGQTVGGLSCIEAESS